MSHLRTIIIMYLFIDVFHSEDDLTSLNSSLIIVSMHNTPSIVHKSREINLNSSFIKISLDRTYLLTLAYTYLHLLTYLHLRTIKRLFTKYTISSMNLWCL